MTTTIRILPAALLAIALTAACGHHAAEQAPALLSPVTARLASVEKISEGKAIEAYGLVQPAREASVSSRVMGPVVALHVAAGARVRRGQALLEIGPETSQGQVVQARGALAQAQAALALAERNHQRYAALHAEKAASDVELDMARMQRDQARGAVEQAEGAVQVASSVAAEAVVRAPFAARVVETLVEVGDLAAPGRPLVRVESVAGSELWLDVRAADLAQVAIGQRLPLRLDSRPDLGALFGTVAKILPAADPATHTITVKVDLGTLEIASGLAGRAQLAGQVTERLVVPASAVHRRGGLVLVVVRSGDGSARTHAVTTGAVLADGRVEVLSGLAAGEQVLLDAPGPLADGTPVEVAP